MSEDDVYKKRDFVLGEIHQTTKNTQNTLLEIRNWCREHDKKDDRRFLIGGIAILMIAGLTGVLPEVLKLIK